MKKIMIDHILQLMDEIEKSKPPSESHEVNGRYVFPERWILLRRRLLQIEGDASHGREVHKISARK